jgi:hypothetical protein
MMQRPVRRVCVAALLVACLAGAGCAASGQHTSEDAESSYVEQIQGTNLKMVILTQQAARDIGLQTGPVRSYTSVAQAPNKKSVTVVDPCVPTTAVIYDPTGQAWVYEATSTLTYVRAPITISQATSETTYLTAGPQPGTTIVTVGAPELLGVEYGVGGE